MAKEGSVAPKERVNIVYKPAVGNQEEFIELPHRQLVLGDFTGKPDTRRVEDRAPINVSRDNFDEVLRAHNVEVEMTVPNRLAEDPEAVMNLNLKIDKMKDMEPDAICRSVPEIKKILDLRNALMALKGPLSNTPAFRKKLQELIEDDEQREDLLKQLGL